MNFVQEQLKAITTRDPVYTSQYNCAQISRFKKRDSACINRNLKTDLVAKFETAITLEPSYLKPCIFEVHSNDVFVFVQHHILGLLWVQFPFRYNTIYNKSNSIALYCFYPEQILSGRQSNIPKRKVAPRS